MELQTYLHSVDGYIGLLYFFTSKISCKNKKLYGVWQVKATAHTSDVKKVCPLRV